MALSAANPDGIAVGALEHRGTVRPGLAPPGTLPKLAVLDVDGTLVPGALGRRLAGGLAARGAAVDLVGLDEVLTGYRDGRISHETMTARAHRIYAEGMAGLTVDEVRVAATQVWAEAAAQVFGYVRPLTAGLRAAGYLIVLISGSPAEIVGLAAADLGADQWRGATLRIADNRYLPVIEAAPATPGGKVRALRGVLDGLGAVDLTASLAVGNTATDIDVLRLVGRPHAFEPDPGLAAVAAAHGWPVVDRASALTHLLDPAHSARGIK